MFRQLATKADSSISDVDFARSVLQVAGRKSARPTNEKFDDPESPPDCDDLAATATVDDLEAFATRVTEKNAFLRNGWTHKSEQVSDRPEGESAIAFLRRALKFRRDADRKATADLFGSATSGLRDSLQDSLRQMSERSTYINEQVAASRALMRAAEAVPSAHERLEKMADAIDGQFNAVRSEMENIAQTGLRIFSELELASRSTNRFNTYLLAIAVLSLVAATVISGWTLKKMYVDSEHTDKRDEASTRMLDVQTQEMRALRQDLKAQTSQAAQRDANSKSSIEAMTSELRGLRRDLKPAPQSPAKPAGTK
jgi:hypothetical protein